MGLDDLNVLPGLYTLDTDRGSKARYKDGDHVRFYKGLPEKIGGWVQASASTFTGTCRGLVDWKSLRAQLLVGVGTHLKLMVWDTGAFYNMTPLSSSGTLGADPFTTTLDSTQVSVAHTAHGRAAGDYVDFDGAAAVGGITIDGEYAVTTVTDDDNYVITHSAAATSSTTGGGAAVDYEYELAVGLLSSTAGFGWGAGTWGESTYGTPRPTSNFLTMCRIWHLALWGEDLIAHPRGGAIYVWDSSAGTATRATRITQSPLTARAIFITDQNRTIVALGAHDGAADDPMLVRWCDEEDYTVWTAAEGNTAGDKRLDQGNELYCAVKTKRETLIFSDSWLWSMVYIGPPYTYGFDQLGPNGGLMGPNAAFEAQGRVWWMGQKEFHVYDGAVRVLPCEVLNHVMDDINRDQRAKVFGFYNRLFGEAWWLYCSEDSTEIDRYVAVNIDERTWHFGTLDEDGYVRTAMIGDSDIFSLPYGAGTDGYLYDHETTVNADGGALASYLESADIELGQGERTMLLKKLVPDFKRLSGSVSLTCKAKRYPQSSQQLSESTGTITSSTEYLNPRIKGRQVAIRISSSAIGDDWRMGKNRVLAVPHGKK